MTARREPGNAEVEDLFTRKDGQPSALLKRLKNQGKDLKTYKRWRVRWVDYDGEQKTKSFARKVDARKFRDDITTKITRGEYIDFAHGKTTVATVYDQWEPTTVYLGVKTRYDRQNSWNNHVQPRWGKKELAQVRKADVQAWVTALHEDGKGESTISRAVEVLRLTLQHAMDAGWILSNPAKGIRIPRAEKRERYYLTVSQVEALATAIGEEYSTLIRVFSYCGLRWGEASALRVRDVDLERGRLQVVKAFTSDGGKRVEKDTKSHEQRSVPFPAALRGGLVAATKGRGPLERVFTTPAGTVLNPSNFRQRDYLPALKQAGQALGTPLPPVTIHELRHTAASLAVSAGANVKAIQRMLGHKSAAMTLDIYSDLFDDDLDEVAVRMDQLIADEKG